MTPEELKALHLSDEQAVSLMEAASVNGLYEPWAARMREIAPKRLRPLSSAELLAWAAGGGRLRKIKSAIDDSQLGDQIQSIAESAYLMLTRDATLLDLSLPDRAAMFGALVQAGVLTPDDLDSVTALATVDADITVNDRGKVR